MVHGSKVREMNEVKTKAILAKQASLEMALFSAEVKNAFLQSLATLLREKTVNLYWMRMKSISRTIKSV